MMTNQRNQTLQIDNSKEVTWKITKLNDKHRLLKDQEAISEEVLIINLPKEQEADLHSDKNHQLEIMVEK